MQFDSTLKKLEAMLYEMNCKERDRYRMIFSHMRNIKDIIMKKQIDKCNRI